MALVAINTNRKYNNVNILYQNRIKLITDNSKVLCPFREKSSVNDTDEEEELRLLYRDNKIYAIGHGVSVKWNKDNDKVNEIETTVIPTTRVISVEATP